MRLIIELDGPVFDIADAHYAAYQQAAAEVGWSRVSQADYWRLVRTKGREGNILPGAKPLKVKEFHERFDVVVEADEMVSRAVPQDDIAATLGRVARQATFVGVTLGRNVPARRTLLERAALARFIAQAEALSADPRRRPAELKALAAGDRRTIVVAASDALVRAAREAELFALGLAAGTCTGARLQQAGADHVYRELAELAESIDTGTTDLVKAGLAPISFG